MLARLWPKISISACGLVLPGKLFACLSLGTRSPEYLENNYSL